jgi:HlyD family secretion protein
MKLLSLATFKKQKAETADVPEASEPSAASEAREKPPARVFIQSSFQHGVDHIKRIFDTTAPANDDGRVEIRRGLIVIAGFFGVLGGWAALAPLDAGVTAGGVIVVSGSRQAVQHRDGGIVTRLAVKDGDKVERGQILLELATVEISAREQAQRGELVELEALRARLFAESVGSKEVIEPATWASLAPEERAEANAVLARQQQELGIRKGSLSAQSNVLSQRRQELRSRISGYDEQIKSVDTQTKLIEDELDGVRQLYEKGYAPLNRVRALERQRADLIGQRGSLTAQIQQTRETIGETSMQGISITQDRAQEIAQQIRDTDTRIAQLRPQLVATRAQLEQSRIRAPASGTVMGLNVVTVGGVVAPGARLMDIVPADQPLIIEARVRPEDADDLHPGMSTLVRLTA